MQTDVAINLNESLHDSSNLQLYSSYRAGRLLSSNVIVKCEFAVYVDSKFQQFVTVIRNRLHVIDNFTSFNHTLTPSYGNINGRQTFLATKFKQKKKK